MGWQLWVVLILVAAAAVYLVMRYYRAGRNPGGGCGCGSEDGGCPLGDPASCGLSRGGSCSGCTLPSGGGENS